METKANLIAITIFLHSKKKTDDDKTHSLILILLDDWQRNESTIIQFAL